MKKKIKQFIYNTLAIFNILLIIIYKILVLPRTILDFSKLKVVYMIVDEILYS